MVKTPTEWIGEGRTTKGMKLISHGRPEFGNTKIQIAMDCVGVPESKRCRSIGMTSFLFERGNLLMDRRPRSRNPVYGPIPACLPVFSSDLRAALACARLPAAFPAGAGSTGHS